MLTFPCRHACVRARASQRKSSGAYACRWCPTASKQAGRARPPHSQDPPVIRGGKKNFCPWVGARVACAGCLPTVPCLRALHKMGIRGVCRWCPTVSVHTVRQAGWPRKPPRLTHTMGLHTRDASRGPAGGNLVYDSHGPSGALQGWSGGRGSHTGCLDHNQAGDLACMYLTATQIP